MTLLELPIVAGRNYNSLGLAASFWLVRWLYLLMETTYGLRVGPLALADDLYGPTLRLNGELPGLVLTRTRR